MIMAPELETHRHPSSYVDPAGALYDVNGEILRGIRPDYARYYARLLDDPLVQSMIGRQIIDTRIEPAGLPAYELTLWHRKVSPVSYCYEWPAPMLRDAASLTLDICLMLADHHLVLQDAYPWNVLFEGPRPVFVDFTSIVAQDSHLLWMAYDQFCRFFLYPLVILSCRPGKVARSLLLDHINGISDDEMLGLLPRRALSRMPWLIARVYVPRLLLGLATRLGKTKAMIDLGARLNPTSKARRAFFHSLQRNVESIPLSAGKSRWSRYYADIGSFMNPSNPHRKQATVAHILNEKRPTTVVDIGCNRGGYAIMAAQAGARVVAFDTDEVSVSLLFELAKEKQLSILPLVMDFLNPSPACGWRAAQFPSALQRLRSDMALALALTHHLAITQRQTFERIVPALADYAERWLLTEFVPLDDPRSKEIMTTHRRDMSWYSLDAFTSALRQVFSRVELFPSFPEGRTLILCTR